MLKFYTLKELEPTECVNILIKTKSRRIQAGKAQPFYYVVCPYKNTDNKWIFEEADGEQYCCWTEREIEGWCSLNDIEKNEIW
jgi:hypothetical protein